MKKKSENPILEENIKRHIDVIFENVQDQFIAFGEGQQILSDKVDGLEGKFDKMQGDITNMQDDITEIKHKLSEKVDLSDFQKLEKRFIKLERLVLAKR